MLLFLVPPRMQTTACQLNTTLRHIDDSERTARASSTALASTNGARLVGFCIIGQAQKGTWLLASILTKVDAFTLM